jgi:hypothetical protein
MANASASAEAAADINDKCPRWLSKPSVTSVGGGIFSHGGHMNSMVAGGHVNLMVAMEVRIEVYADVECTHAVILYSHLAMTDGPC